MILNTGDLNEQLENIVQNVTLTEEDRRQLNESIQTSSTDNENISFYKFDINLKMFFFQMQLFQKFCQIYIILKYFYFVNRL